MSEIDDWLEMDYEDRYGDPDMDFDEPAEIDYDDQGEDE